MITVLNRHRIAPVLAISGGWTDHRAMGSGRLQGLDALRGVAALLVVVGHTDSMVGEGWLFARYYLAVDFFFMLSGFVMERTYGGSRLEELGSVRFTVKRLKRLWAPMAAGALIGAIPYLSITSAFNVFGLLITGLALIPALSGFAIFPLNPPAWSILFELAANFLHAQILRLCSTIGLLLITGASLLILVFHGGLDVGWKPETFAYGIPRVILNYAGGILLYRKFGERRGLSSLFPILLLPTSIILLGALSAPKWADFAFAIGFCPLAILMALPRDVPLWPFRLLGRLSFPLYAVHVPVVEIALRNHLGAPTSIVLAFATAGLVSVTLDPKGLLSVRDRKRLRRSVRPSVVGEIGTRPPG